MCLRSESVDENCEHPQKNLIITIYIFIAEVSQMLSLSEYVHVFARIRLFIKILHSQQRCLNASKLSKYPKKSKYLHLAPICTLKMQRCSSESLGTFGYIDHFYDEYDEWKWTKWKIQNGFNCLKKSKTVYMLALTFDPLPSR